MLETTTVQAFRERIEELRVSPGFRHYEFVRDRVVEMLRKIGLQPEVPKASLYVWTPVPSGYDSGEFAAKVIDEAGVIITPGLGFGPSGDSHFRISLTTPDDRLKEGLDRLAKLRL